LQKVTPVAKTAQQILDDFVREVQLEKGQRVRIEQIPAHASNWAPVLDNKSVEMIERYALAFKTLRKRHPAVDWSDVKLVSGRRILGTDGIF
jgi:hypothetical protein